MDTSREKFFQQNAGIYKTHLPTILLKRFYVIDLIKKPYHVFEMGERNSLSFKLEIQNREGFFPVVMLTIKYIYPEKNTEQVFLNTKVKKYSFHKKNLVSGNFSNENGDVKNFDNYSGYLFAENALLAEQTEAYVKIICKEIDKVMDLTPKGRSIKKEEQACECVIC